jgi:hypothetical protein
MEGQPPYGDQVHSGVWNILQTPERMWTSELLSLAGQRLESLSVTLPVSRPWGLSAFLIIYGATVSLRKWDREPECLYFVLSPFLQGEWSILEKESNVHPYVYLQAFQTHLVGRGGLRCDWSSENQWETLKCKWGIKGIHSWDNQFEAFLKVAMSRAPVAHACNPSYSGGRDQADHDSKPAWANSLRDPISKIPFTKKGWWSDSRCRPWVQTPVLKKKNRGRASVKTGWRDSTRWPSRSVLWILQVTIFFMGTKASRRVFKLHRASLLDRG